MGVGLCKGRRRRGRGRSEWEGICGVDGFGEIESNIPWVACLSNDGMNEHTLSNPDCKVVRYAYRAYISIAASYDQNG